MISPYEKLANAIILQATKDYRDAKKKLARDKNNLTANNRKAECIDFFRSNWFGILTELNPEFLIKALDKEV